LLEFAKTPRIEGAEGIVDRPAGVTIRTMCGLTAAFRSSSGVTHY